MDKIALYKRMYKLALPVALENFIYTFINFVDVFMVGRNIPHLNLGANAIVALSFSNQVYFLFIVSLYGLLSGANILSAQYFGIKDYKNLKKVIVVSLITGILIQIPFFVSSMFFANNVLGFFTKDSLVTSLGVSYLRIMCLSFPMIAISFSFTMSLRAVNLPKYSLYASTFSLLVNISLNIILINKYGVIGAAIATVIARFVSMCYLIFVLKYKNIPIIPNFKDIISTKFSMFKKVYGYSVYTFTHEMLWALATTVKTKILANIGIIAFSSIQIAYNISSLLSVFFFGTCDATSIIVGNELGKGNKELAYEYSKECIKIHIFLCAIIMFILYLIGPLTLKIMKVDLEVMKVATPVLRMLCITTVVFSTVAFFLIGFLRAGGDVKFAILAEDIPIWFIGIPITYLVVNYLSLPVEWVFLATYTDEFIILFIAIRRYLSKKWINTVI